METKRKTPLQVEALQRFYEEESYPSRMEMEDLAESLDLTFKQVRTWFIEKRRREKSDNGIDLPIPPNKKLPHPSGKNGVGVVAATMIDKRRDSSVCDRLIKTRSTSLKYNRMSSAVENGIDRRRQKMIIPQDLLTPDYILKKVFRKDGPPLGVEFDSPRAFCGCKDSGNSDSALQENQRAVKRRKVSKHDKIDCHDYSMKSNPVKKHGIGKGLMTVWRLVNPNGGRFPTGIDFADRQVTDVPQRAISVSRKPPLQKKRVQQLGSLLKQRMLEKKLQDMRKSTMKKRQVISSKDANPTQPRKEKCELALERLVSQECLDQIAMLVDDEELELRELEAGLKSNPSTCCDHISTNGLHGCSLCRDLLAKFPPNSVKMKQPFATQPWDSSPETVKKLFKVFHFLYTYSATVDICSYTLDEFAQAFHDKDSFLLGKIHVALLKVLLSDVKTELSKGCLPRFSVSCKFLALLHSVEDQEIFVEFWNESLNPLTWAEILRQVFVAAGFGSKQGSLRRESLSKEMSLMVKYGLRPGTLKGELFRVLLEQGSNGLKVSQLANLSQMAELNLAGTTEELESLICSTLSSDITLFEKISPSAYRLRVISSKEASGFDSDTEDSGSVEDNSNYAGTCSSSDDSECDSENHCQRRLKHVNCRKSNNKMLTVHNEIDESHPGEVWLLGLIEGEYSDLSIEEKLNALVALIDLVSAGSSIRMEVSAKSIVESVPSIYYGSGAKIKRSLSNQQNFPRPSWVHVGQHGVKGTHTSELRPVDSSSIISKLSKEKCSSNEKNAKETEVSVDLHPMQSVYLGSDRRYNRYWLFLGPCNVYDPGHKRVYFESSEDGHWEVIDTEEALRALLSVLDDRGKREALLIESLEKREAFLCQAMTTSLVNDSGMKESYRSESDIVREDSSSPVSDVDNNLNLTEITKDSLPPLGAIVLVVGKKGEEQNRKWSRLQEFDVWIWNSFYLNLNAVKNGKRSYLDSLARCESCHDLYWRDEKHCKICHTTFELDFDLEERYAIHAATCRGKGDNNTSAKHKILSSQLQSLKAAVHAIESVMPEDALVGAWTKSAHRLWIKRLRRTSTLAELLQVIADFVGAINGDWLRQMKVEREVNTVIEEVISCFPSIPQTSSALALWLVQLDALIAPYLERVNSEKHQEIRTRFRGKHVIVQ